MGQWQTERGRGCDEMADILGEAFRKISNLEEALIMVDLADAIEFVSRGMLLVEVHVAATQSNYRRRNGRFTIAEILDYPDLFPTIPNRGQIQGGTYDPDRPFRDRDDRRGATR